jgi:hypothetical protein
MARPPVNRKILQTFVRFPSCCEAQRRWPEEGPLRKQNKVANFNPGYPSPDLAVVKVDAITEILRARRNYM